MFQSNSVLIQPDIQNLFFFVSLNVNFTGSTGTLSMACLKYNSCNKTNNLWRYYFSVSFLPVPVYHQNLYKDLEIWECDEDDGDQYFLDITLTDSNAPF